jgi:hypothetical protein
MTRHFVRTWLFALAVALVAGVFACGGSGENPAGPTTSGGTSNPGGSGNPGVPSTSGKGRLTLAMTDSPFSEADAVLVTFDAVSIHRSGAGWESLDFKAENGQPVQDRVCDLKQLQGPIDVLGVDELPAGHYTQIRLSVSNATIYFGSGPSTGDPCSAVAPAGGDPYPVQISSGEIKLNREFTLEAGSNMMIVLDFDGDKSIHQTGGGNGNGNSNSKAKYIMNPVIGILSVGATQ